MSNRLVDRSVLASLSPAVVRLGMALGVLAAATSPAQAQESCPVPAVAADAQPSLMDHIRYLADDALEGREVATAGAHCAGAYVAAALAAAGLQPGQDGSWFQEFEVRTGSRLGAHNLLEVGGASYPLGQAWVPYGYAATGEVEGRLAYAGTLGDVDGDPHAQPFGPGGLEGVFVVVEGVSDQPDGFDAHFPALLAQRAGAAGMIVLMQDDALPSLDGEMRGALGIPVAAVAGSAPDELRSAAERGEAVRTMTHVEARTGVARNVVGLLPGSASGTGAIVVGAHYDHLGHGGAGSLDPDAEGTIHNGADDNASGTAALIEVARALAAGPVPGRDVVFVAFSGEERGLWGSAWYADHSSVELESIEAMLNMDMVGRLEGRPLTIFGVGTAPEWDGLLADAVESVNASGTELTIATAPDGYGPSDHSSFYGKDIPVLHFFSNTHADYHRPSDDWDRIDAEGLSTVTALVTEVARRLVGTERMAAADLTLIKGAGSPQSPPGSSDEPAASSGYGPYLGTVPDMTPGQVAGVRLTGVREGSPAALAGLQSGDVIVEFAGQEVTDLYAYTYALRDHRPGDQVTIVILRDGERMEVEAVLGRR